MENNNNTLNTFYIDILKEDEEAENNVILTVFVCLYGEMMSVLCCIVLWWHQAFAWQITNGRQTLMMAIWQNFVAAPNATTTTGTDVSTPTIMSFWVSDISSKACIW